MASKSFYSEITYHFEIDSKKIKSEIVLLSFKLKESLSYPYRAKVRLAFSSTDFDIKNLLGENCQLHILRNTYCRRFCGIILKAKDDGYLSGKQIIALDFVPAFYLLSQESICRIYLNQSVPELLENLLTPLLTRFKRKIYFRLYEQYSNRELCIQYEESHFHFASRLMAEEGLFYYFKHEEGMEKMIVADSNKVFKSHQEIPWSEQSSKDLEVEFIEKIRFKEQLCPNRSRVLDYDWTQPDLKLNHLHSFPEPSSSFREIQIAQGFESSSYDQKNLHHKIHRGGEKARKLLDRQKVSSYRGAGKSYIRDFSPGTLIQLNDLYLITAVEHCGKSPDPFVSKAFLLEENCSMSASESQRKKQKYWNCFQCIPEKNTFRPILRKNRQVLFGPQLAVVVGPPEEEIFTDEYGRIQIRFVWEQHGRNCLTNPCWIRVSQLWAGSGFGAVFIPRVGMEVIVHFLHGNPNYPIVTGCLFNGTHFPPLLLPQEKSKTIFKTRSLFDAKSFNALCFEDKKGMEKIEIQAKR